MSDVVLDISRLLSRVFYATPTGIDRVEMAYAEELLKTYPDLAFSVVHRGRFYGRVSRSAAIDFLAFCARRWATGERESKLQRWRIRLYWMARLRLHRVPRPTRPRVLIQASPHHLHREDLIRNILKREGARWIVLIHDLIPMQYPEFARPDGDEMHRRRMTTVARHASAILTNSDDTTRQWQRFFPTHHAIVRRIHLGTFQPIEPDPKATPIDEARPYFVVIGTIEPRKNHLMLLNIWRQMAEDHGPSAIPRLILVGRRGWENENVIDMLDRSTLLQDCVTELHHVTDTELAALLRGSRALLMPSFAEGFGMPLTEALDSGVPAIASDLPVLREIGQDVPEYIDPLDGLGWMHAVLDYAPADSPARAAQLGRLAGWHRPDWPTHLKIVSELVEQLRSDVAG